MIKSGTGVCLSFEQLRKGNFMNGENRKRKRRNQMHRWMAMALTVSMLAGQGKIDVWAQEGGDDVPPAAEVSEEIRADVPDDCDAEDGSGDTDQSDENIDAAGENGPEEDGGENADGQDTCVCDTRCTEETVNVDCPVCVVDYTACVGKEAEEVLSETVTENTLDGEVGIAALADEGVEAYAVGETLTCDGLTYVVTGADEVEVGRQDADVISGDIVIPEIFEKEGVTYRVTGIGEEAFDRCYQMTGIKIPGSVINIGKNAFCGCEGLSSVEIPRGVRSIGETAFSFCTGITSVEIPDSVTSIEICAFQDCSSLTSVKIPDSVTNIGPSVFHNCSSLTKAEIPDDWTIIADAMFRGCNSLTSVNVPEGVTDIGSCAFEWCSSLTSMVIPEGVTRIKECAFQYCIALTDIVVPQNVTDIEIAAFQGCSGLTSVTVSENITEIGHRAFNDCEKLREMRIVVLSDGKIRFPAVGPYAFDGTPDERYIIFVDRAGQELTGEALGAAQNAFLEAARSDGSDDGRWYGWSVRGLSYNPSGSGSGDHAGSGSNNGSSAGDIQVTVVSEMASIPIEDSVTESTDETQISGGQEAGAVVLVPESADMAEGTSEQPASEREPNTGDATHVEIYATIAMIAGLAYLFFYFMEEERGMTEREKEVFVAAFIRWGRRGGSFRKGCAVVAIFCLLAYYHAIGKRGDKNALRCLECNPS